MPTQGWQAVDIQVGEVNRYNSVNPSCTPWQGRNKGVNTKVSRVATEKVNFTLHILQRCTPIRIVEWDHKLRKTRYVRTFQPRVSICTISRVHKWSKKLSCICLIGYNPLVSREMNSKTKSSAGRLSCRLYIKSGGHLPSGVQSKRKDSIKLHGW